MCYIHQDIQCPGTGTENSRKPEGAAPHKGGGHIKFQDEEYPDLGTTNKKSGKMTSENQHFKALCYGSGYAFLLSKDGWGTGQRWNSWTSIGQKTRVYS